MLHIYDIVRAQTALRGVLRDTRPIPTDICRGCNLYLKPENLQVTGSFKIRGAYNKIAALTDAEKQRGVIACSSGNHAQGVALAAQKMGVRAAICMPESAPKIKIESTRAYGAEVILVPGVYDDAYEKALELQQERGCTFVHPFNDEAVIAGQGTIALEILRDLPQTDVIITAIGGGGLISGIAFAAKQLKPEIRVYGVQASGAPSMYASFAAGYIRKLEHVKTFADGIAVKETGNIAFDLVKTWVDDVFTVDDETILEAIKRMMNREKMLSEGAGAVSVAAVLADRIPDLAGKNVVCVVSGGNIDVPLLSKTILDGLE